jgi:hypothetical protein
VEELLASIEELRRSLGDQEASRESGRMAFALKREDLRLIGFDLLSGA